MSSDLAPRVLFKTIIFAITVIKSSLEIVRRTSSFSSNDLSKRLLNLYRPTGERSYLSGVNKELMNSLAFSGVAMSPSLKRLYISIYESLNVLATSFAKQASITSLQLGVFSNAFNIVSLVL